MNEQTINQEKMTSIPSRELRALRAQIKQMKSELDRERGSNGMLLYLLGMGKDNAVERDKMIIILQEKVLQAITMLENSVDPLAIIKMLKEDVDFSKAHQTFLMGMKERHITIRSNTGDKAKSLDQ